MQTLATAPRPATTPAFGAAPPPAATPIFAAVKEGLFATAAQAQPPPSHPLAAPAREDTREDVPAAGAAASSLARPTSAVAVADARAAADSRTEEVSAAVVVRVPGAKAVQPAQTPQQAAERRALVELCLKSSRAVAVGKSESGRGQGTAAAGTTVGLSQLYVIGKPIGEGAYGFVRIAQQRLTLQLVAVKTFDKQRLRDPGARRRLENEIRVLQRVRHKHVVRLFEVFESAKRVHLCMEHVPCGTLARLIRRQKRLPEPLARRLLRQLVGALSYLHHRCIAHRDVKLENVLIDEAGDAKLIDFGFSIVSRSRLRVPCGSLSYTAPEIVRGCDYDGPLADVWSLGVLLYVMLVGKFPFVGATKDELSRHILRGQFALPVHVTREPETLLRAMMIIDASRREPCERLARHAWLERASASEPEICTEHQKVGELEAELMAELAELGVGGESARESITQCRHDHVHTTYQLLRKKQQHPAPSMASVELESQLGGGNSDEAQVC